MKQLDVRVKNKWRLVHKIGEGGFGMVYLGEDVESGEEVAIKLEDRKISPSSLAREAHIYEMLAGAPGILAVHWAGWDCDFRCMVVELLGPSLEDLFCYCDRRFSLKTVLMIALQCLNRLKHMHSKGFIHRDVKPENFLMGRGRLGNCIHIVDMGLAREFNPILIPRQDSEEEGLRKERRDLRLLRVVGTSRYASISGHRGIRQSKRDDLESLGYMMIYFLNGQLPWEDISASSNATRNLSVFYRKKSISLEELCEDQPREILAYFEHVKSLAFADTPDYARLQRLLCSLFSNRGYKYDNIFDWTIKRFEEIQSPSKELGNGNKIESDDVVKCDECQGIDEEDVNGKDDELEQVGADDVDDHNESEKLTETENSGVGLGASRASNTANFC